MNLTNNEARQACLDMWEWLSKKENTGEANGYLLDEDRTKQRYFDAHPELEKPYQLCHACEFAYARHTFCVMENCPIKWPSTYDFSTPCCTFDLSPYNAWCANPTAANAKKFRDFVEQHWPVEKEYTLKEKIQKLLERAHMEGQHCANFKLDNASYFEAMTSANKLIETLDTTTYYMVIRYGVYIQGIYGVYTSLKDAFAAKTEAKEKEPDEYHTFKIVSSTLDKREYIDTRENEIY